MSPLIQPSPLTILKPSAELIVQALVPSLSLISVQFQEFASSTISIAFL